MWGGGATPNTCVFYCFLRSPCFSPWRFFEICHVLQVTSTDDETVLEKSTGSTSIDVHKKRQGSPAEGGTNRTRFTRFQTRKETVDSFKMDVFFDAFWPFCMANSSSCGFKNHQLSPNLNTCLPSLNYSCANLQTFSRFCIRFWRFWVSHQHLYHFT